MDMSRKDRAPRNEMKTMDLGVNVRFKGHSSLAIRNDLIITRRMRRGQAGS